jgi:hypothetical protein
VAQDAQLWFPGRGIAGRPAKDAKTEQRMVLRGFQRSGGMYYHCPDRGIGIVESRSPRLQCGCKMQPLPSFHPIWNHEHDFFESV